MASLMADSPDQDLFGDVPIDANDSAGNATSLDGAMVLSEDSQVGSSPFVAATTTAGLVSPPSTGMNTLGASLPPMTGITNNSAQGAAMIPGMAPSNPAMDSMVPTIPTESVLPSSAPASDAKFPAPAAPVASPSQPSSLLAQSGLLGMAGGVGLVEGDQGTSEKVTDAPESGLFDAVDEEEHRKLEEDKRLREEAEEAEQAALLEKKQEEELRQRQLEQQQQQPFGYVSQQQQLPFSPNMQHPQQQQPLPLQQSTMMQSVVLNPPPQQQQLQAGMQNLTLSAKSRAQPPNIGFYREHPPSVFGAGGSLPPSNAYGGTPAPQNQYYYGTQQQAPAPTTPQPNITAGMHNATPTMPGAPMQPGMMGGNLGQVRKITLVKPEDFTPLYTEIKVTEPMLIQQQNFLLSSSPYWSYQITSSLANNQGTWIVRRRFKHVVALEDRLRQTCQGSILPPRPDKHAARALEEASTQQSAEFALQRARELQQYLNALAQHPVAGQSQVLRLFFGLQDDIGTAWPEVSGNAFTKLGAVAAGMSMKVAETTNLAGANAAVHEWEDNAELLTLCSSENIRMGAVSQAVPKLEGTVTILREQGDASGAVGMEMSKITKQNAASADDYKACDILSNGLLRNGRRTKRLALELSAAMDSFLQQYKLVRYEKMAMNDRRQAIQRKGNMRRGADQRAMYLAQQQHRLQAAGQFGQLNHLEQSAIRTDSMANDIGGEAEEIAVRLKSEIHRVAIDRRTQWNASMKTIASSMKEACTERLAIWESTLEALQALGGMPEPVDVVSDVAASPILGVTPNASANANMSDVTMNVPVAANVAGAFGGAQGQAVISSSAINQVDSSTIYA